MPQRVVVISDTHLSSRTPEAGANFEAAARYIAGSGVDLVVHVGDLAFDAVNMAADLTHAATLLSALTVPCVVVPGNHDIGDNPGVSRQPTVRPDHLDAWRDTIGPDWWAVDCGGWTLLGLDAQLFGSGLPAEAAQDAWLAEQLAGLPRDRPLIVVTHKPLVASAAELAAAPRDRFVPAPHRDRLRQQLAARRVELVLSGHVHQYRMLAERGGRHVWAPSTWAVFPDDRQPAVGIKTCGVLTLDLHADGGLGVDLVTPPGLRQHQVWRRLR